MATKAGMHAVAACLPARRHGGTAAVTVSSGHCWIPTTATAGRSRFGEAGQLKTLTPLAVLSKFSACSQHKNGQLLPTSIQPEVTTQRNRWWLHRATERALASAAKPAFGHKMHGQMLGCSQLCLPRLFAQEDHDTSVDR